MTSSSALQALGPAKSPGGGDKFFRSPGSGACKEPSGRKNLFTRGGGGGEGAWTSSSALRTLGPAKSPQSGRACSRPAGGGGVDKFFRSVGSGACKEPSERKNLLRGEGGTSSVYSFSERAKRPSKKECAFPYHCRCCALLSWQVFFGVVAREACCNHGCITSSFQVVGCIDRSRTQQKAQQSKGELVFLRARRNYVLPVETERTVSGKVLDKCDVAVHTPRN